MPSFMEQALDEARKARDRGEVPVGCVVVRDGMVMAAAGNRTLADRDPTAHAEMLAIRAASQALASPDLAGCVVYASGHPCPMCLAAMRLSGVSEVAYAYSNDEGEPFGLSTAAVYAELARPFAEQSMRIRHVPFGAGEPDLYAAWRERQAPER